MKIAIASGKGGTGKTTISVGLALSVAEERAVQLLDCDVEEPNAGLFLDMGSCITVPAFVNSYAVDKKKCTSCGKCAVSCRFNAIGMARDYPVFFNEICHGCGGCVLACPAEAVITGKREIGVINKVSRANLRFLSGLLDIGESMSAPLIRHVIASADNDFDLIIDSPPGTSCSMLAAVEAADYVILVTEPTPFGINDLEMAVAAVRSSNKAFGVIVNRSTPDNDIIRNYCLSEGIDLLLEVAASRDIAEGYSRGVPITALRPDLNKRLVDVFHGIRSALSTKEFG